MGSIVDTPCQTCRGSGRERRTKRYTVRIPAGVKDGTRIKLKGKGEAGYGGAAAGDLFVVTRVEPSSVYERRGEDLVVQVPVSYSTAALGGQVEVPTIEGRRQKLVVPTGTQTGKQFRLRGKGMTELHGHARGDMLVEFVVETPVNLTKRQQELLREFEREFGNEGVKANGHHPESEGFFAKVKELWDELTDQGP
jgi:molecular chaperone DnaJ